MDKCPDKTYNDNGVCKPCHQSCKDTCNGPEDTIGINGCNACKNLKDGVYCTKECPTHKFEDKGECKFCHENCLEECTGSGPDSCITNACNYGSYEDGNGECKPCHENCYGSCTGPNSIIGLGGCKACKNKTYNGTDCMKDCPDTSYDEHDSCIPCNANCAKGCSGAGPDKCDDCKNIKDELNCVEKCPDNKYESNGECQGIEFYRFLEVSLYELYKLICYLNK